MQQPARTRSVTQFRGLYAMSATVTRPAATAKGTKSRPPVSGDRPKKRAS